MFFQPTTSTSSSLRLPVGFILLITLGTFFGILCIAVVIFVRRRRIWKLESRGVVLEVAENPQLITPARLDAESDPNFNIYNEYGDNALLTPPVLESPATFSASFEEESETLDKTIDQTLDKALDKTLAKSLEKFDIGDFEAINSLENRDDVIEEYDDGEEYDEVIA
jgi:hypothetical protein